MSIGWTTEQIVALAPDASSIKAGKELASARKWVSTGCGETALWGECQGSGAKPYQTTIALDGPAFHCSCPSRKFPCKHGLGLFLLWAAQAGAVAQSDPPEWVTSWIEGRAERAEQKAKKEQERQEKRASGESVVDPAAQKKRETARWAKVSAGVEDLGLWIGDLVRHGLAALHQKPADLWENQGRRLIDAQAPGLARRLRGLGELPRSGAGWQGPLLDRLARIHLAVEGCRRFESLPPDVRDELRAVVGLPVDQDAVRAGPGVRDTWQVVGQRVEVEDRLRTQRTWCVGRASGRPALVLDFAYGTTQPLDATLPPGMQFDAELAFFPATAPLRALVKARHSAPASIGTPAGTATVREAYAAYAAILGRNPWVELVPLVLNDVWLQPAGDGWIVRDAEGRVLPVSQRFAAGWAWLGLTGGSPFTIAGEFDGAVLEPLACWLEERFCPVASADDGSPVSSGAAVAASDVLADLWCDVSATALVGTERRPPPSLAEVPVLAEALGELQEREPALRLLGLAAGVSQYCRVGHEPPLTPAAALDVCPPEMLPDCTPAQDARLGRILSGEQPELLDEWLTHAHSSGLRASPARLAELLGRITRLRTTHPGLHAILGARGRWLAALNSDWQILKGDADSADPDAIWQTGTRAERVSALRVLRARDAPRGRSLVESTWASDPADDRASFVAALAVGLGPEDESFLEAALDDRGKNVRKEAVACLAHLPDSAFARRMAERAGMIVRWDGGTLVVEPPSKCDPAMVRDGIVAKPPKGIGERGWWLRQVVAATPLRGWEDALGREPSSLVAAANATEWGQELWLSWGEAALRERAERWASILLEHRPAALELDGMRARLLAILAPAERDAHLLALLAKHDGPLHADHPVWPLVSAVDSPISPVLARVVLSRLRDAVAQDEAASPRPRYDYRLAQFLTPLGRLVPAALAPELDRLWPRAGDESSYYSIAFDQMSTLLHFRYEMQQEFTR